MWKFVCLYGSNWLTKNNYQLFDMDFEMSHMIDLGKLNYNKIPIYMCKW
jgi:hypothetical protein